MFKFPLNPLYQSTVLPAPLTPPPPQSSNNNPVKIPTQYSALSNPVSAPPAPASPRTKVGFPLLRLNRISFLPAQGGRLLNDL